MSIVLTLGILLISYAMQLTISENIFDQQAEGTESPMTEEEIKQKIIGYKYNIQSLLL